MKKFSLLLTLSVAFTMTSCMSKKKHIEAVQLLKMDHEKMYTSEADTWRRNLNEAQDEILALRLQLSEQKGENNVLVNLRSELKAKIAQLEGQIENVSSSSQSTQQSLSSTLIDKENEIAALKAKLKNVESVLTRHKAEFTRLSSDIHYAFQEMNYTDFELVSTNESVRLIFPEGLLFRKSKTDRIQKRGVEIMESLSKVITRFPIMDIDIVGHTDNSPTGRKSITDNWTLSTAQASRVIDLLTNEFDVNTNQLTAAGKGEFAPRSSNGTAEGKAKNRRIEFVFTQRGEGLEKAIRKEL